MTLENNTVYSQSKKLMLVSTDNSITLAKYMYFHQLCDSSCLSLAMHLLHL